MKRRSPRLPLAAAALLLLAGAGVPRAAHAQAATASADRQAAVDAVFERYDGTDRPGCAVGVSEAGAITLERAYGMSNLEHDVANTPISVFENGSVSKQFTAAATILLALDGRIALDDDIRTYFPEIPDYGEPITVRHLLNHTSGLRDWGSVAGIHGWPRTTRVHDHRHALDIIARQQELNYPPGTHYSYTNTGYNLQAMLIERVTGRPFAEFTKERLFDPLGMTRTQWRDEYRRVVEDRAIAYRPVGGGAFYMDMPFEQVHGNGGLLTTVGDLLRWTRNLETGELGGPDLLAEMHRQGVLDSGREISYASGLVVTNYRGVPEVQHGGATAGYRAFLTRFPEQGVAVAVLCNRADTNAGGLAHDVADVWLAAVVVEETDDAAPTPIQVDPDALERLSGTYRNTRFHDALRIEVREDRLLVDGRVPMIPTAPRAFVGAGRTMVVDEAAPGTRPAFITVDAAADTLRFEPVQPFDPTPSELEAYTGTWHSPEAEATYTIEVRDGGLVLVDRYGRARPIQPAYLDTFEIGGNVFRFIRDASGAITEMRWGQGRVWSLRFEQVG
jgi:CubicO group peptidase (beta-lactamase class C family)